MKEGSRILAIKSDTPELDTSLLLAYSLKIRREKLYLEPEKTPEEKEISRFFYTLDQRSSGISLAYITGKKEFYGRDFFVGPGILSPRPDSETMIERVLELKDRFPENCRVLDLCTGSGCLAITLKKENPEWLVEASDISPLSKHYFSKNSQKLEEKIPFYQSNLFSGITSRYNLIITNPPYLTSDETETKQGSGDNEAGLTLDGGGIDGLDLIRIIINQSPYYLSSEGGLFIEAAPWQLEIIAELLKQKGFSSVSINNDLAGRMRIAGGFYP